MPTSDLSRVAVVVPALDEERSVGIVVADLRRHFPRVVVVDDGSHDATADLARAAGAEVVSHHTNLGQGAALQTGICYLMGDASVDHVVTFDSDGQHRVEDALRMVALAQADALDVVLGSRFLERAPEMPFARRVVLRAGVAFTRATTGLTLTDTHNGLRVLSRRAAQTLDLTLAGMAHASQLLGQVARQKLSYAEVPVVVDYADPTRRRGQSNVNALNIVVDLALERLRSAG